MSKHTGTFYYSAWFHKYWHFPHKNVFQNEFKFCSFPHPAFLWQRILLFLSKASNLEISLSPPKKVLRCTTMPTWKPVYGPFYISCPNSSSSLRSLCHSELESLIIPGHGLPSAPRARRAFWTPDASCLHKVPLSLSYSLLPGRAPAAVLTLMVLDSPETSLCWAQGSWLPCVSWLMPHGTLTLHFNHGTNMAL